MNTSSQKIGLEKWKYRSSKLVEIWNLLHYMDINNQKKYFGNFFSEFCQIDYDAKSHNSIFSVLVESWFSKDKYLIRQIIIQKDKRYDDIWDLSKYGIITGIE